MGVKGSQSVQFGSKHLKSSDVKGFKGLQYETNHECQSNKQNIL